METILQLILIQIIIVNLIDLSGFIDTIKYFLWKHYVKVGDYHNLNIKPLSCSYCMNHHVAVIYLLIIGDFTLLNYMIVLLLSFMTPVIADLLNYIKDVLIYIQNKLYKLIS